MKTKNYTLSDIKFFQDLCLGFIRKPLNKAVCLPLASCCLNNKSCEGLPLLFARNGFNYCNKHLLACVYDSSGNPKIPKLK